MKIRKFLETLPLINTYHGMAVMIYNCFPFLIFYQSHYVKAAADIEEHIVIEMSCAKERDGITYNCVLSQNGVSYVIWSISKKKAKQHYEKPIVYDEHIALLGIS